MEEKITSIPDNGPGANAERALPGKIDLQQNETENIRREIEYNEPNQLTNRTGSVDGSPLNEMEYGYYDDGQDDFNIG